MGNWSDYILKLFQSTLPRRERRYRKIQSQCCIKISIHTPTKGATDIIILKFHFFIISIHTPTKGATFTEKFISNFINYFNLHSHEGSDASLLLLSQVERNFNPHSHEGSDKVFVNYLILCK